MTIGSLSEFGDAKNSYRPLSCQSSGIPYIYNLQRMCMKYLFSLWLVLGFWGLQAQENPNEKICSRQYQFCFQIPPNVFMLSEGDIESSKVIYRTVDGKSWIRIETNTLLKADDTHQVHEQFVKELKTQKARINLNKEGESNFVLSGFTKSGRGFYAKVILQQHHYTKLWYEFPKPSSKCAAVSQMVYDYFLAAP